MSLTRHERRTLREIEFALSQDPNLCEVFATIYPRHPGRQRLPSDPAKRPRERPDRLLARVGASLAMQFAVGGLCSEGSNTGQVWLIAVGMIAYPFAFTPLVRQCRRTSPQDPSTDGMT